MIWDYKINKYFSTLHVHCFAEQIGNGNKWDNKTSVGQQQDWEFNVWSVTPQRGQLPRSKNNMLAADLAYYQLGERFQRQGQLFQLQTTTSS